MSRIAIIGAGAIGSMLGALLSRAGQDVTLIGRSEHLNAISQNGLIVNGVLGTFATHPTTAEILNELPDFAFLTVKTQDVLPALQTNLPFLGGVTVVTFQNGLRSDELVATLLPRAQIISTVVNSGASYLTPGTVTINYSGSLVVGRPFGTHDYEVDLVAGILRAAIPTAVSDNIQGAHWLKLIVNLNNAFPAMTNLTIPQVYANSYLRQLAVRVMREGLKVAKGANIQLESLPGTSVGLIQLMAKLPIQLASQLLGANIRKIDSEWPLMGSTLQSLRRGRPTEIDYLNGEIVRLGQQLSIPTPLNATIVEVVHQIEHTGQFLQAETIRSRFSSDQ
jgi:2-dehydropantoate 2-reductase